MGVIMDQRKDMESDAGYGFLARVPIDGSDEQVSAAQRCALAPIDGCREVAREALGVGGKSERSERCAKHSFEVS